MSQPWYFSYPFAIAIDNKGFVYVADSDNHRIQKFTPEGGFVTKFSQYGSDPGGLNRPSGIATGPEGRVYVADTDNHRIQVFTTTVPERIQKAIICAGGGPYPGNSIWDATSIWASFAYTVLKNHGFTREGICYLTPDTGISSDPNDSIEVDGSPSIDTMHHAITEWAADPHTIPMWAAVQDAVVNDVIIYLIDHGGENTFRLSGLEILSSTDLDQWLSTLQGKISGRLILIMDSCQSGSFIQGLTPYPAGERIIITSTSAGERAIFASNGSLSFSGFFWTGIRAGSTPKEAFDKARDAMEYVPHSQHPLLDDNGNNQGNDPNDGRVAEGIHIGTTILWDSNAPVIGNAEVNPRSSAPNSAFILAENVTDTDRIDRVWAIITPPGYAQGMPNRSITKLPELTLMPFEFEDIRYYMGIYPKFNTRGEYTISLYAMDEKSNRSRPRSITFNYAADYKDPLRVRAIILAGETSGALSPAMRHNISLACTSLKFQGYEDSDLYILCSSSIPDNSNAPPGIQGLDYAINTWAANGTKELLLYLTGEGDPEGLRINSKETLSATQLDTWLDDLQRDTDAIATLIYDATSSGSFLPFLIPPEGRKRIVITSTKSDQPAHILFGGVLSFSSFLWGTIINGENLDDAFLYAASAIRFTSTQVPMLDDNGDGRGYMAGSDGIFARGADHRLRVCSGR